MFTSNLMDIAYAFYPVATFSQNKKFIDEILLPQITQVSGTEVGTRHPFLIGEHECEIVVRAGEEQYLIITPKAIYPISNSGKAGELNQEHSLCVMEQMAAMNPDNTICGAFGIVQKKDSLELNSILYGAFSQFIASVNKHNFKEGHAQSTEVTLDNTSATIIIEALDFNEEDQVCDLSLTIKHHRLDMEGKLHGFFIPLVAQDVEVEFPELQLGEM